MTCRNEAADAHYAPLPRIRSRTELGEGKEKGAVAQRYILEGKLSGHATGRSSPHSLSRSRPLTPSSSRAYLSWTLLTVIMVNWQSPEEIAHDGSRCWKA